MEKCREGCCIFEGSIGQEDHSKNMREQEKDNGEPPSNPRERTRGRTTVFPVLLFGVEASFGSRTGPRKRRMDEPGAGSRGQFVTCRRPFWPPN